jgi:Major Facilitator Superfamily
MVGFGKSIVMARRESWRQAYLDYDALKDIVNQIEFCLTDRRSQDFGLSRVREVGATIEDDHIVALKVKFFSELKLEIEKMSLFILQQQGKVADAVGALRFAGSLPGLFDQRNLLLLENNESDEPAISSPDTKLDRYAVLGVELLHLLKFITINSIGISKILKKYNKVFEKLDFPHQYFVSGEHLQQLAFSPSIRSIESSIHTALAECFGHLPLATATNQTTLVRLQVTRLQCVMSCSNRLQKNAEILQRPFLDFLSHKAMIATGSHLGGMGDSGKKSLKWLIRLRPDDLLTMSEKELEDLWTQWSDGPTAVKPTEQDHFRRLPPRSYRSLRDLLREPDTEDEKSVGQIPLLVDEKKWLWGGVTAASMTLNLLSVLLYTVNYYIVAPTANHYAVKLGHDGAYGSTLIGASSFSALFAAFFYSFWYTKSSFKSALMFSAFCPVVGNLVYALAISFDSMTIALLGRILCGFGSAEVINRQLIAACVDFEGMTKASAFFVAASAIGMSLGPLLAAVLDMATGRDADVDILLPFLPVGGIIIDHVTSPGFLMSILWLLQLLALVVVFQEPRRINGGFDSTTASQSLDYPDSVDPENEDDDTGSLARQRGNEYGAIPTSVEGMDRVHGKRLSFLDEAAITVSLVFENPSLPVTVLLFGYIEMADEVLISSCSMVLRRYFGWNGSAAGFLIASLGALVLPAHVFVERASHIYSERNILVVSYWTSSSCLNCYLWP